MRVSAVMGHNTEMCVPHIYVPDVDPKSYASIAFKSRLSQWGYSGWDTDGKVCPALIPMPALHLKRYGTPGHTFFGFKESVFCPTIFYITESRFYQIAA